MNEEIKYQDTYILEGIGGEQVVDTIVQTFAKSVQQSSYLSQFFENVDTKHNARMQKRYLLHIITSTPLPPEMTKRMQKIHLQLGLENSDFDKVKALYAQALSKAKVHLILAEIILDRIEMSRNLMVANPKTHPIASIPFDDGLSMILKSIGGLAGADKIATRVNEMITDDEILSPFFADTPMVSQKNMLKKFLILAFKRDSISPKMKKHMRSAHAKLKLNESHFDQMIVLYSRTLEEMKISKNTQKLVLDLVEDIREDILGNENTQETYVLMENKEEALVISSKSAELMGIAKKPIAKQLPRVDSDHIEKLLGREENSKLDKFFGESTENRKLSHVDTPKIKMPTEEEDESSIKNVSKVTSPAHGTAESVPPQHQERPSIHVEAIPPQNQNAEPSDSNSTRPSVAKSPWAGRKSLTSQDNNSTAGPKGFMGLMRNMSFKIQNALEGSQAATNKDNLSPLAVNPPVIQLPSDQSMQLNTECSIPEQDRPMMVLSTSILVGIEDSVSSGGRSGMILRQHSLTDDDSSRGPHSSLSPEQSLDAPNSGPLVEDPSDAEDYILDEKEALMKFAHFRKNSISRRSSYKEPSPEKKNPAAQTASSRRRESFNITRSLSQSSTTPSVVLPDLPKSMTKTPSKSSIHSISNVPVGRTSLLAKKISIGSIHSSTSNSNVNINSNQNSSIGSISKNPDDYIYDSLGGEEGIGTAIDRWADLVLENELLKPFFEKMDMTRMKALQRRYIMLVLTQHTFPQRDIDVLVKAHSKLTLQDEHFDEMKDVYLKAFMCKDAQLIMIELALDRIEKTRDMILGRYKDPLPLEPPKPIPVPINHTITPIHERGMDSEMSVIPEMSIYSTMSSSSKEHPSRF